MNMQSKMKFPFIYSDAFPLVLTISLHFNFDFDIEFTSHCFEIAYPCLLTYNIHFETIYRSRMLHQKKPCSLFRNLQCIWIDFYIAYDLYSRIYA